MQTKNWFPAVKCGPKLLDRAKHCYNDSFWEVVGELSVDVVFDLLALLLYPKVGL